MKTRLQLFSVGIIGVSLLAIQGVVGLKPDPARPQPTRLTQSSELDRNEILMAGFNPLTVSTFSQKQVVENEPIEFTTNFVNDPLLEKGLKQVVQKGVMGNLAKTYLVKLYKGQEIGRRLISQKRVDPKPKIVAKGSKIIIKSLKTSDQGIIHYTQKLKVWATSYSGNCTGCTGRTATGTTVAHGVCAVDPKTIPLGSYFYVHGYGKCHAEDVGGNIKGDMVDLGFENLSTGNWSAHWVAIYIMTE